MANWRLQLFGEVALVGSGAEVSHFRTVRAAKLLVLLGLRRDGKLSRELAAQQLWPEDPPDASKLRLRQEIHRLKASLGEAAALVGSSSADIWLDKSEVSTDLDQLGEEWLPEGAFLPGWDDPWALAERDHAEKIRIEAVTARGQSLLAQGKPGDALAVVRPYVCEHPLNEALRMVAVNAYSQSGSMAAAVAEYQDFRRKVRDNLGIELDAQPPLVSAPPPPAPVVRSRWVNSLPELSDDTYGREELIAEVGGLLTATSRTRVITLVGPGGIGKTRLAIEVLMRVAQEPGRRVSFVTLADVADPSAWPYAVAAQLGIEIPEEASAVPYLGSELATEPTTLVFDNAESILPDRAGELQSLIKSAPTLKVLITSITPTRIEGERTVSVGPLEPETWGLAMLAQAFRDARGGTPSEAAKEDLKQIARRLDGYPLALRLAAARLKLLTPQNLLEQLETSLASARARGLPERHQSLDSALASSIQHLEPELLDALQRIASYPGGLGMELASMEFGDAYLDLLEGLLDTALIVLSEKTGPTRVRLLVPVRRYVHNGLNADRTQELQHRSASHSLAFLTQFELRPGHPVSHDLLSRVDQEDENFRAGWRFALEYDVALALGAAEHMAGYESVRARASRALDDLLALRPSWQDQPKKRLAELELAVAHLCAASYREDLMPECLQAAASAAPVGDRRLAARIALARAEHAFRKDYRRGPETATAAIQAAELAGETYLAAKAHRILANIRDFQGDFAATRAHLDASLKGMLFENAETDAIRTSIYSSTHLWYVGEHDQAAERLAIAYRLLEKSHDPLSFAYLHEVLGRQDIESGDYEAAETHFRESLRIWLAVGCAYQEADQLYCLAKCFAGRGLLRQAKEHLVLSGEAWYRDQNLGGACASLSLLARVLQLEGKLESSAEVVTFSHQLRERHVLTTVKSELDLLAQVESVVGRRVLPPVSLDLEGAMSLFDRIR